jgi:hypothetical protein
MGGPDFIFFLDHTIVSIGSSWKLAISHVSNAGWGEACVGEGCHWVTGTRVLIAGLLPEEQA